MTAQPPQGIQISPPVLSLVLAVVIQVVTLVWFSATQNSKLEELAKKAEDQVSVDEKQDSRMTEIETKAREARERILEESRTNDGASLSERRALERRITELEAIIKSKQP